MKIRMAAIIAIFLGLLCAPPAFASCGWIIYHESAFKGKVIDAETKEPIEGAVVVAVYHIRKYGIGAGIMSDSTVVGVKEDLTNKKGEFFIPSHTFCSLWPFAIGETTEFVIYKHEYTSFPSFDYPRYFPDSPLLKVDILTLSEIFKKGVTVELMKLRTWEERYKANMISISDIPKTKWPILAQMIEKEDEWLRRNKAWRRKVNEDLY